MRNQVQESASRLMESFGLPKHTIEFQLTIGVMKPPVAHVTFYATDRAGKMMVVDDALQTLAADFLLVPRDDAFSGAIQADGTRQWPRRSERFS